jgi:hypothetical protein
MDGAAVLLMPDCQLEYVCLLPVLQEKSRYTYLKGKGPEKALCDRYSEEAPPLFCDRLRGNIALVL